VRRLAAVVALAGVVLGSGAARAADPDPWFGRDKALHFGASALLASDGYAVTGFATEDRRVRLAVGGGFALALGGAKELWDMGGHGDASLRDLTWDVAGTVVGLAATYLVDWALTRTRARAARAP
jgi:putative lipoprotein